MNISIKAKIFLVVSVVSFSQITYAGIWTEIGDAGNTPGSAQTTIGNGDLTTIFATLDPATDMDVFKIFINNTANFSISMIGTNIVVDPQLIGDDPELAKEAALASNDTTLYVMDAAGNLLFTNQVENATGLAQLMPGALVGNSAGEYLVAYSSSFSWPIGGINNTTPIIGWDVEPTPPLTGIVQLNFTNAEYAVPEPSSLALSLVGLAGLIMMRRRNNI